MAVVSPLLRTVTVFRRINRGHPSNSWGFSMVLIFTVKNGENGENRVIGAKGRWALGSGQWAARSRPRMAEG